MKETEKPPFKKGDLVKVTKHGNSILILGNIHVVEKCDLWFKHERPGHRYAVKLFGEDHRQYNKWFTKIKQTTLCSPRARK